MRLSDDSGALSPVMSYQYVPTRTILICVNDSDQSRYALHWAVDNILQQGRDLAVIVHCRTPIASPGPYVSFASTESIGGEAEAREKARSHQILKEFALDIKLAGFAVKAVSIRGETREEIIRKATELPADMVIVGSRDLGKIKRTFMGSTSDYLSHHLRIPIVIVKQPRPDTSHTSGASGA